MSSTSARKKVESSPARRPLHRVFDRPAVFNAYQLLIDGGKGRQIRRFLKDVPFSSVLDVGCGTGNWADLGAEKYLGVDLAPEFIAAAAARYPGDATRRFLRMDPTVEELAGSYDLAQMISVLHHLDDEQTRRLLLRIVPRIQYLFVLDLYPIPWNPIARFLYRADRGHFIRSPQDQKRLIESAVDLRLVKDDDYFAPTGLYRHTLLLYENASSPYSASQQRCR